MIDEAEPDDKSEKGSGSKVKNNSYECAYLVNEYWRKLGYDPQARTKKVMGGVIVVVSNMINGYPTRKF